MLTHEDIQRLRAPLPLNDHEVKIKVSPTKDDKGAWKKSMWLAYIDQTGVIPLLQDIDPNYSWLVIDKQRVDPRLCVVTGRLIIGGASYDGVGGATPNYDNDPYSEDTEKAAETDAFKRAAVKCGVGLYLRNAPQIWVDGNLGKGYEAKDAAWAQFSAWYSKTYGMPQNSATKPQNGVSSNPASIPSQTAQNTPNITPEQQEAETASKANGYPIDYSKNPAPNNRNDKYGWDTWLERQAKIYKGPRF